MSPLRARCSHVCLNVVCLAIGLVLVTQVHAQGTGGRILGRISDPSGAVLSGVKVIATNDATGVAHDSVSNDSGDYVFPDLPVGTYSLAFDLTGFKKTVRHAISLDVNQVITLNMTMQIGASQEVVDVTSEAPLVETTSTQLGAVVGDRAVTELPLNSRDTYQFLQLQPGELAWQRPPYSKPESFHETQVTVGYDLTALSEPGAAHLAQFAAGYPQFLAHWEEAISAALG